MATVAADVALLARTDPEFYEEAKRNLRRNFILFMLDGATFGVVLAIFSEQTMLPNYLGIVAPTPALFGILATFWALGRYVPQLIGSYLATGRHKRKKLLLGLAGLERLGMLLIAGSTYLAGRVPDQLAATAFLLAVLLFAVSLGLYMPLAQDFQAKTIVTRRGLLFGVSQLLGGVLGFGTGLIARAAIGESATAASFGRLFLVTFVISGLSLVALSFLAETPLPRVAQRPPLREFLRTVPASIREIPSYKRFLVARATIATGTMGLGFVAAQALEVGIAPREVALFSSVFVLSQAVAGMGWGLIGESFGFKVVMAGGGLALATGLLLAWSGTSTSIFALAFVFLGANNSALFISDPNLTFEMVPPERTVKFLGITNSVTGPSYALAALAGAFISSMLTYRHTIATAAVFATVGAVVALVTVREPRHASPAEVPETDSPASKRPKVAVVGSYGIGWTFDVPSIPAPGETVASHGLVREHGGKGSNQAIAAARLGADVRLLTSVGEDEAGAGALELWSGENIDAQAHRSSKPTMVGTIAVDPTGENAIIIEPGALADLTPAHVDAWRGVLVDCDVCVVQLEIPVLVAMHALQVASAAGVTTILNPAPWTELPADAYRHIDYLVPNEAEAAGLLGRPYERGPEAESALTGLARVATIVTEGPRGATIHHREGWSHREPSPMVDAVDTTGAGDSFVGAFAVGIADGLDLKEAVSLACRAAGRSVTGRGVVPALPHRPDVWKPAIAEGTA